MTATPAHALPAVFIAVAVAVAATIAVVALAPSQALAKSHECTRDVIDATVQTDGSLHVIDSRTYDFEGSYSLTAAVLDPPQNGSVIINGVSVVDENGNTQQLVKVPFQPVWRNSGGPSSGSFAVDELYDTVCAFSNTTDATKTFVFDYTYTNAVTQYTDASVLYWQFIGPNWDVDTQNVTASLHLLVPQGQTVEPGGNVCAFGHGNITGNVGFASDGAIDFEVPKVREGEAAEMRVAFPASWTPDIAASNRIDAEGLPQILQEEEQWNQQTQMQRILSVLLLVIPVAVSVICVIVALALYLRHGREHKPQFQGEYWRDVPEKGMDPAIVARIYRWNQPDANDLTAILMHLSNKKVLKIERTTAIQERKILKDKEYDVYTVELDRQARDAADLDAIETKALDFVFGKVAAGQDSVTLDEIEEYAKEHPQDFVSSMDLWQGTIGMEVEKLNLFEKKGEHFKHTFMLAAVSLVVVGILVSFFTENFLPVIGLLPGALVLFLTSFAMPRRSKDAVEIEARCKALKRWFKDFTNMKESVPTDAKVWGELLVYAYIFGVMEDVVTQLDRVNPGIWSDDVFMGSMLWYYNPYATMHAGAATAGFFGDAFANTMSTAQTALASMGGGGTNFGGGGGGFSMGGGGGFGGGGGGFSR